MPLLLQAFGLNECEIKRGFESSEEPLYFAGFNVQDLATACALERMGSKVTDFANRIDLLRQIRWHIRASYKRFDFRCEIACTDTVMVLKDILENPSAHSSTSFRTDI